MARARRTLDRKTLREQGEAAERKTKVKDEEKDETEDEEEEDEDEDAEEEAAGDDDDSDSDDEDAKPKKKAKKKAPPKKKAPVKRTRAAKIVRMKVVWAVYSNSHQLLQEFAYPKKKDAENYLEKITNDKKSGGPFFMQPLKKPMEKEGEAAPSKK